MISHPDVTIVLPACGGDGSPMLPGLRRALAAIGDDPTVEILVPDDGSDPEAGLWLLAQAAADPRLRVLRAEADGGMAWAYNIGIEAARAPLVAFLDAADAWQPGKLGAQRALHAGHPALGFSFADAALVSAAGAEAGTALAAWPRFRRRHGAHRTTFLLGADALAQLFAENVVTTSTVLARTDLLRELGGFAIELGAAAPWDLWLRLAAQAPVACRPDATVRTPARSPAQLAGLMDEVAARHGPAARRQGRVPARRFGVRSVTALAAAMLRAG